MKEKTAKIISVVTVAPLFAILVCAWLYLADRGLFGGSPGWLAFCFLFVTLIPVLAYPMKKLFPSIDAQGRDGERKLAFITGISGYMAGTVLCLTMKAPRVVTQLLLSYLVCGAILLIINKYAGIKASGHACGVAGPIAFLALYAGGAAWAAFLLLPPVFRARLVLGRHDLKQLVLGTLTGLIPTVCIVLSGIG